MNPGRSIEPVLQHPLSAKPDFDAGKFHDAPIFNHGWTRMNTDAGSGPEVRKKVAHGETVGITVNWDEPRLAASKHGEDG